MQNLDTSPVGEAERYWSSLGFVTIVDPESTALIGIMPDGVIGFLATGASQIEQQRRALQAIGIPPVIWCEPAEGVKLALFTLGGNLTLKQIRDHFGARTGVKGPGDPVRLPDTIDPDRDELPSSLDELSAFDSLSEYSGEQEKSSVVDLPQQIDGGTLLYRFSLLDFDFTDEVLCTPLLGTIVLSGQATVVYAPPGSGKTLLMIHLVVKAVEEGLLQASRTYVVNADDSLEGVQAKRTILAEFGVNMLVPGLQGFESQKLASSMAAMIEKGDCINVTIVVDTLKKFVDLMDKKNAAAFGDLVRRFVLAGGTFFALAHTRKNEGGDGRLVYAGTTDILEDFDAACLLVPVPGSSAQNEKLVQFQFAKRRGRNAEQTFAFNDDPQLTYEERLASVRTVEEHELGEKLSYEQYRKDEKIINAIRWALAGGESQKMLLIKAACDRCGASRQAVLEVLERYTGNDPTSSQWRYEVRARGAKLYWAHPVQEDIE